MTSGVIRMVFLVTLVSLAQGCRKRQQQSVLSEDPVFEKIMTKNITDAYLDEIIRIQKLNMREWDKELLREALENGSVDLMVVEAPDSSEDSPKLLTFMITQRFEGDPNSGTPRYRAVLDFGYAPEDPDYKTYNGLFKEAFKFFEVGVIGGTADNADAGDKVNLAFTGPTVIQIKQAFLNHTTPLEREFGFDPVKQIGNNSVIEGTGETGNEDWTADRYFIRGADGGERQAILQHFYEFGGKRFLKDSNLSSSIPEYWAIARDNFSDFRTNTLRNPNNHTNSDLVSPEVKDDIFGLIAGRKNVVVTGPKGEGKTFSVFNLMAEYVRGNLSVELTAKLDKRFQGKVPFIFEMDLNKVMSDTSYRGQLEDKLNAIVELSKKHPVILLADEFHYLSTFKQDLFKNFKSQMSAGQIVLVGTSTELEFEASAMFWDDALLDRSMVVTIDAGTPEEVIQKIEKYHDKQKGDLRVNTTMKDNDLARLIYDYARAADPVGGRMRTPITFLYEGHLAIETNILGREPATQEDIEKYLREYYKLSEDVWIPRTGGSVSKDFNERFNSDKAKELMGVNRDAVANAVRSSQRSVNDETPQTSIFFSDIDAVALKVQTDNIAAVLGREVISIDVLNTKTSDEFFNEMRKLVRSRNPHFGLKVIRIDNFDKAAPQLQSDIRKMLGSKRFALRSPGTGVMQETVLGQTLFTLSGSKFTGEQLGFHNSVDKQSEGDADRLKSYQQRLEPLLLDFLKDLGVSKIPDALRTELVNYVREDIDTSSTEEVSDILINRSIVEFFRDKGGIIKCLGVEFD